MKPLDPLALPLDRACLIEASAGTGKTYTMVNLYLRLLLGGQFSAVLKEQQRIRLGDAPNPLEPSR